MEIKFRDGTIIEHDGPYTIEKYQTKLYNSKEAQLKNDCRTILPNSMIASIEGSNHKFLYTTAKFVGERPTEHEYNSINKNL